MRIFSCFLANIKNGFYFSVYVFGASESTKKCAHTHTHTLTFLCFIPLSLSLTLAFIPPSFALFPLPSSPLIPPLSTPSSLSPALPSSGWDAEAACKEGKWPGAGWVLGEPPVLPDDPTRGPGDCCMMIPLFTATAPHSLSLCLPYLTIESPVLDSREEGGVYPLTDQAGYTIEIEWL